jgi:hypothetical protein
MQGRELPGRRMGSESTKTPMRRSLFG